MAARFVCAFSTEPSRFGVKPAACEEAMARFQPLLEACLPTPYFGERDAYQSFVCRQCLVDESSMTSQKPVKPRTICSQTITSFALAAPRRTAFVGNAQNNTQCTRLATVYCSLPSRWYWPECKVYEKSTPLYHALL